MADTGELFKLVRSASADRRAANREAAPDRLREAGLDFLVRNDGAHLIVAREWDFWPGTGKWCHRGPPNASGRGLDGLVERIRRGT